MKKVLSVFLAALMMFSVMAVGASAWDYEGYPANSDQSILVYDLNGGTFRDAQNVYNVYTSKFEYRVLTDAESKAKYVQAPETESDFRSGSKVSLPAVTAPKGYQFDGWYCLDDHNTYGAGPSTYTVPAGKEGKVIEFRAAYSPDAPESDTFAKVFEILIKVFGTIYGVLTGGDTEKGIATMRKLFAGLLD